MATEIIGKVEIKSCEKTHNGKTTYEELNIEWKIIISSFNIYVIRDYRSPAFSFANNSWFLMLCHKASNADDMASYLKSKLLIEHAVEYSFGFVKLDCGCRGICFYVSSPHRRSQEDGKMPLTGILKGNDVSETCVSTNLWKIIKALYTMAPSRELTITCTLKRVLDKPGPQKLTNLEALSEDFRDLLENKESCDTTLCVKDKEYKVHRAVLIARSAVFAAMFQHDMAEKQTGIIDIPDCEPESFQQFLEYLYCGKLEGISFHSAFHLYSTSDKYNVQNLKAICVEYLMQCITAENICDIVMLADKYDETELFAAAQDFFNRNFNQILETSEWECLLKENYRLGKKLLKEMSLKMSK